MTEDRLTVRPPLDGRAAAGAEPDEGEAPEVLERPEAEAGEAVETVVAAEEAPAPEDELERVAAQRDEYLAIAQRTQADFENYRKRAVREAMVAEQRGVGRLAREVLPALDDLERALAAAAEGQSEETLLEGMRLVARGLRAALERCGIESFGEPGEPFDPERHEAVAQQVCEGVPAGAVAEVYQAGYRFADGAILRPARVIVAG